MKIRCIRCGNVRYTDQPSPPKDEIGAAMCFNCREVTICNVYAKEGKMNFESFLNDLKNSPSFVKENVMCYFYHNTSACQNCPNETCNKREPRNLTNKKEL